MIAGAAGGILDPQRGVPGLGVEAVAVDCVRRVTDDIEPSVGISAAPGAWRTRANSRTLAGLWTYSSAIMLDCENVAV
jgi:hypothetical protein